jgi:hypothetical protein
MRTTLLDFQSFLKGYDAAIGERQYQRGSPRPHEFEQAIRKHANDQILKFLLGQLAGIVGVVKGDYVIAATQTEALRDATRVVYMMLGQRVRQILADVESPPVMLAKPNLPDGSS